MGGCQPLVGTDAALVEANLGWRLVPTKVGTYQSIGGCQPLVGTDAFAGHGPALLW